jgi:hypothetical protein
MQIFGGTAQSIANNVMSFSVLFVLWYQSSWDLLQHKTLINITVHAPSAALTACYAASLLLPEGGLAATAALYGYVYIRLLCFCLALFMHIATVRQVRQMLPTATTERNCLLTSMLLPPPRRGSLQMQAVVTLVSRLLYYPLVQVVSRVRFSL